MKDIICKIGAIIDEAERMKPMSDPVFHRMSYNGRDTIHGLKA